MANIPPATPPPAVAAEVLPTGVKVDHSHSADTFFAAHKAANPEGGAPPAAAAPPAVAAPMIPAATPPAVAAAAAEVPPVVESPTKGSLAEKLAAKAAKQPVAAPAAQPPPASGKNPEDEVVLASSYSAPAHESFNKIKGITAGLRDQLNAARETERQLKAQLDAAKAGVVAAPVPEAAEVERLRTENKTMSDRLALVDLREHPKFQSEFIDPANQALAEAQALLTANDVQGIDLQSLLNKPRSELGKAVSELGAKLPDFDRTEFAENIRKAWTLNQRGAEALSKSKEIYGGLRAQTETAQRQAFERTWGRAAGQVAEHIVELEAPDNATPEMVTAVEHYNAQFKGLRTVAEQRAFGPANSEAIAENAIKSAAYDFHINQAMPRLMGEYTALLNINRQMVAQLQAIRARNPNIQISGGSSGPAGGAGPDGTLSNTDLSKMTHAEAAAALAPRRTG